MLFGLGLSTKIYIGVEAVDMRKGFNGLHGLVRDHLGHDPLSWPPILVHERFAHQTEGIGMGRQRIVGMRQAS
jgi:transposase